MTAPKKRAEASAPKPARKAAQRPQAAGNKAPEATHEVLRHVVIDGEDRVPGDEVALSGLDAAELESHGYVRKR